MRHILAFLTSRLPTDSVQRDVLLGQMRHVLGVIGTLMVSGGVISADAVGPLTEALMQLAGGGLVLAAMVASWRAKVAPPAPAQAPVPGDGGPVATKLGLLALLALAPALAACDSLTRAAVPLVATLAPATACALDIAAAVQAPGETHASDTAKAVAASSALITDPACMAAANAVVGAVTASAAPVPAAPPAPASALLLPPTLPPVK